MVIEGDVIIFSLLSWQNPIWMDVVPGGFFCELVHKKKYAGTTLGTLVLP
jgi:hypothetical protein